MRIVRFTFLVIVSASFHGRSVAQQTPSSTAQAVKLLQQSLIALNPGPPTRDVTVSGTAQYIAGSDDETGTAVLKATAVGASRIDLSLPSGSRIEVRDATTDSPTGTWSSPDHVTHSIPPHNLFTESAWFFPAIVLARRISGSDSVVNYVGHETRNSAAVEHLTIYRSFSTLPSHTNALMQHLTQLDIYLDSSTFLPLAIAFNIHPDDDAGLDIPMEVGFSDYRSVNGVQVPFHIQKYLNNGLILDLQFKSAAINSGLALSDFAIQ